MLTIATVNVNGLRAAVRRGMPAWLEERQPDVLLLQEVRAPDAVVRDLLGEGWHVTHVEATAKGRAGVAIASRLPFADVRESLPAPESGEEPEGDVGRWVEADLALADGRTLTLVSTYLYSGTAGTPSMDAKYAHLDRVSERLETLARQELAVLGGDINIGHRELDIKNWKGNRTSAGFLPAERAYLDRWYGDPDLEHDGGAAGTGGAIGAGLGLVDVARRVEGDVPGPYTWWSWRGKAFDNDSGWRIDVQAVTPALAASVVEQAVDRAATYDARFSDHAPYVVRYDVG
ncbi:exodeoxyribonuclease III [Litorihabitans aurantiacus]|uniref:Exodeoxyribonuclease III n=1 Tax=Litorihabitans aurantiacus TaxID=1930061 RepID=A0AA37XFP3_9MICO|nr:exodeoxyribonuclease III [Litorihabitans aurantiacus]GMA32182.1 exodeoxyribonuclease III [Litorihabitans aurantiacus]